MDTKNQFRETQQFTTGWFNSVKKTWEVLLAQLPAKNMLEIGCFEGASTCFMIDTFASQRDISLYCIDTWKGGIDHGQSNPDFLSVENRFKKNVSISIENAKYSVDLNIYKGYSEHKLPELLADKKANFFDFIYIDGSHVAADVLFDAVCCFKLLKIGGVIAFDDYLWSDPHSNGINPILCPKLAIDAFVNVYCNKLRTVSAPLYQYYIQKVSD